MKDLVNQAKIFKPPFLINDQDKIRRRVNFHYFFTALDHMCANIKSLKSVFLDLPNVPDLKHKNSNI